MHYDRLEEGGTSEKGEKQVTVVFFWGVGYGNVFELFWVNIKEHLIDNMIRICLVLYHTAKLSSREALPYCAPTSGECFCSYIAFGDICSGFS